MATDSEGYLINECSWQQIQAPWLNLVCDFRDTCVNVLGDRLHSLYLRGSVPRGLAIPHLSDLDSVVILRGAIEPDLDTHLHALQIQLTQRYRFCPKVEIALIFDTEIQLSESPWQAILQTQGVCIYGQDVRSHLPRFKPGLALISHAFDLADDLAETQAFLRQLPADHPRSEARMKEQCSWIARRMVRTGFELVMETTGSFTRDLYPCYECFSHYFSAQEPLMRKALELAVQPSGNRAGVLMFLSHFGSWLVEAVELTIARAN